MTGQESMDVGAAAQAASAPLSFPWTKPCHDTGPYVWERWVSARRRVYVAMTCNRPVRHPDEHQWSDGTTGVTFTWGRDGKPINPLPIERSR